MGRRPYRLAARDRRTISRSAAARKRRPFNGLLGGNLRQGNDKD